LDESFLTLFSLKRRKYENNFNEIRIISSGNFGIVCKAVDKNFGKTFAIKKIPFNKNQKEKLPKNPKSTQS
jgi:serine/threonine protein kinase